MEKFWKVIEKAGWVIGILTGMATILGWQFNVMTFVKLGIYGSGFCLLTCIFLLANFKYNYIEFKMKKSLVVICTFIFFCLFVFSFSALGATTDKAETIKELPNTSITKETKTIESSTQETQEIIKDLKIEELPKEWETVEFNDDYFSKKVEVGSSGNLKTIVKATNGGYLDYSIFSDELNKEVLEKRISSSSTAAPKVEEITSDLSPGSYEIRIGKRESYGNEEKKEEKVEWKNEFVDFAETATKPNNSIEQAMDMKMNSDIISSFTLTDEVGFYKFETNTSGSLNLIISAYMETLKFELLDKDGQQIESYGGRLYGGTMKEPTTEEKRFDLEPGTYLIKFEKGETGKYTIKNTFEVGSNNTDSKNDEITTAFPINRGEKQELFMSMQDENHYFTFELPEASKIEVIISAEINTLNFEILSSENLLTVKDKNLYLNGSAKDIKTERLEFDLDKGSYILKVGKNNGTGKYSLIIN